MSPGQQLRGGEELLNILRTVLARCEAAGLRLGYPGEGGERPFRGWLVSDFLTSGLGWPSDRVVVGERFDVILQDAQGFPIATIETKTPYAKATKKDHKDFEARLDGYGTLRTAYFTNGAEWERLDIMAPTGDLVITGRHSLRLDHASAEEAEAFFAPLAAERYFSGAPRLGRHSVTATNGHILEALAVDLDQAIRDISAFLMHLFAGLRAGQGGLPAQQVTLSLFELWCEKSLIVSPAHATEIISALFDGTVPSRRDLVRSIGGLGFTQPDSERLADTLGSIPKSRLSRMAVMDALWPAYASAVDKLAAQTAHVLVARALLYRIGEDQQLFPIRLSAHGLDSALTASADTVIDQPPPITELLNATRLALETFLPTVYKLGEFDWWLLTPEKRSVLSASDRTWVQTMDAQLETALARLLRVLDGYTFARVDVDVWRNVYQHYLPPDERQRLGGFYTPDELINFILDLAEFESGAEGLCLLSFLDPACGSGAFVVTALARVLSHLELDLPCHADLGTARLPEWKRAEAVLRLVQSHLHAVDRHPFAAFLTTLNVLFLLMPMYVKARTKNRDFSLDLRIFSADSLEKSDSELLTPDLFSQLNSRIQLSADSLRRYQEMLGQRFDRLFGNPPWGGLLKGELAPVYGNVQKLRFAKEYPNAAHGKYDVYGLFIERSLQILNSAGRLAFVTQGTFLDKEWASQLRGLLATHANVRYLIDLNPFGQLFFHAMNTPCVIVADAAPSNLPDPEFIGLLSSPVHWPRGTTTEERRRKVVQTLRAAIAGVRTAGPRGFAKDFAVAACLPVKRLRETAPSRWSLRAEPPRHASVGPLTVTASDLFDSPQGVTPGGSLDLFLMSREEAANLQLEATLLHRAIKSKEIERWRSHWSGRFLLYPYRVTSDRAVPAFRIRLSEVSDQDTKTLIRSKGLKDALDFETLLDSDEESITRRRGVRAATVPDLLQHRLALGIIRFPKTAAYLAAHYERLEGRVFEKKRFRDLGKQWYEYHRPRDPRLMFSKERIVTPTLVREVSFAIDTSSYLSDHACLFMQPTPRTASAFGSFRASMAKVLGRPVVDLDILRYCVAFLNSTYAQDVLVSDRRPTPKGFYPVNEDYLADVRIPVPTGREATNTIVELVAGLSGKRNPDQIREAEAELERLVAKSLAR